MQAEKHRKFDETPVQSHEGWLINSQLEKKHLLNIPLWNVEDLFAFRIHMHSSVKQIEVFRCYMH